MTRSEQLFRVGEPDTKKPPQRGLFILSASYFPPGQPEIRLPASAFGATFPGPPPPSPRCRRANGRLSRTFWCRLPSPGDRLSHPICSRAKHSQSSARRAHPAREVHSQAGPRVHLMRRHQLLLTTPLLLAPVPQGLKMHTHRCILRSRLLKFVQSLYPPYSVASLVTGSKIHEDPRTRIVAIGILTALLA